MSSNTLTGTRAAFVLLWVLRCVAAALFLFAAYMKLGSDPKMVAEFDLLPVGQWFRYLTGFLEAIGGITLLVPLVSVFAAILLLCVDIGAFFAQLFFLKGDVIHTFVVAAVLIAIIYLQRHQLRRSLGKLA